MAERNVTFDEHLETLTLSDSFFLTVAVVLIAFLLPVGGRWAATTDPDESMRTPLASWEDDFNRLFAGLPARRLTGFRIWDDMVAFQGSINPTTTQALRVESPFEIYWKARSYGTYTGKGWISEETVSNSSASLRSSSRRPKNASEFRLLTRSLPSMHPRACFPKTGSSKSDKMW